MSLDAHHQRTPVYLLRWPLSPFLFISNIYKIVFTTDNRVIIYATCADVSVKLSPYAWSVTRMPGITRALMKSAEIHSGVHYDALTQYR